MKKLLFTLVGVVFFAVAASAQGVLKFNKTTHDFGKITAGPVAYYTFEAKNTGTAPVVISDAKAVCGCTTPEWSKDPILPGQTRTIKVGFTTAGKNETFNKTVTVYSNAENNNVVLTIKGIVSTAAKTSGK